MLRFGRFARALDLMSFRQGQHLWSHDSDLSESTLTMAAVWATLGRAPSAPYATLHTPRSMGAVPCSHLLQSDILVPHFVPHFTDACGDAADLATSLEALSGAPGCTGGSGWLPSGCLRWRRSTCSHHSSQIAFGAPCLQWTCAQSAWYGQQTSRSRAVGS